MSDNGNGSNTRPLWMPTGSVRSILAIGITAAYILGYIAELEVLTLVLGFYFGARSSNGNGS